MDPVDPLWSTPPVTQSDLQKVHSLNQALNLRGIKTLLEARVFDQAFKPLNASLNVPLLSSCQALRAFKHGLEHFLHSTLITHALAKTVFGVLILTDVALRGADGVKVILCVVCAGAMWRMVTVRWRSGCVGCVWEGGVATY